MTDYRPEGALIERNTNKARLKSLFSLKEAMASGDILEARALICDAGHSLITDLNGIRGVIPREDCVIGLDSGKTKDIAIISRVNKAVCFKITDFQADEKGKPYVVLSRKQAQEECLENYINKLSPGDIIPARVTHLEPFGAFVDIGCGISSLIPIDAISVSRISHPSDRFKVGQNIFGIVKEKDEFGRICLSHKELLGSWEENASMFSAGQTVSGIVRSVEDYGIFVELTPNLAGLAEPKENVRIGQQASVYIKSLIPEKMKVKLIIVDAFDAAYQETDLFYFRTQGRMDNFRYSPSESRRVVETIF
ncbi:MAG: S1 RNA-binding domain-containing protein [Oscillospiraceae bacterium]|nr:S1 RNA-binding domain-containing protein [Oscillospiraceae bacterium]